MTVKAEDFYKQLERNVKSTKHGGLDGWLQEKRASCMWQKRLPNLLVECWAFPGASLAPVAVVIRYDTGGWDIFTGSKTIGIEATLADAERRLGV